MGSCPPPQLASWVNTGLDWGPAKDMPLLQGHIRDLLERDISLVVVTQVMLIRRILPYKRRPLRLWEFDPEGPRALQHFLGITPVEMYKLFFGSQVMCPDATEDVGLSCNRPDTQVSSPVSGHTIRSFITTSRLKELSLKHEWVAKAKLIRCPAPLPETSPNPVLTRMLEIVPLEENEEGDNGATASSKESVGKGGIKNSSTHGKKRTASNDPETMVSKQGKKSSAEGPAPGDTSAILCPQGN